MNEEESIDYGLDAPDVIKNLIIGGCAVLLVRISAFYGIPLSQKLMSLYSACGNLWVAGSLLSTAALMIFSSRLGKRWQRDKLLDQIVWRGDEHVLDVGCGRGLLMIGAAKRLNTGKVVGIDIWSRDLSGNTKEAALVNAQLEGVSCSLEIHDADVRKLPFSDHSFDIVMSNLVIHNIVNTREREKAIKEMVRVLKPGGTLIIQDFQYTKKYQEILQQHTDVTAIFRSGLQWWMFPPVRLVTAKKQPQ